MTNPLLSSFTLPPFSAIKPEHVVPAVTQALDDCRAAVERVVAQGRRTVGITLSSRWPKWAIA